MGSSVKTTIIGSYPIDVDRLEQINGYYNQSYISWNKYIKDAVNKQINAGIDVIADGQTRDPFLNIFYRKIKGCRIRDRPEVIDKVEFSGPITIEDQKYVRKIIPKNKKLIGLIAGPYTLTQSCKNLFYKDDKELAFDFAEALKNEAKMLEDHVDMISVDEPFFSVQMPEYAKELISIVTKNISLEKRLHVCGDVSDIIPQLIELPIDVLSHEFKAKPELFDKFIQYDFNQKICLGGVRSDESRIEPVDEIVAHLKKAKKLFEDKIAYISPDCGQRMRTPYEAFQKLKNLVEAKRIVYG